MLVLIKLSGQRSNQFMHHIHLDAYCKEHNITFCNLHFGQYKKFYPNLKLPYNNALHKFFLRVILKLNWTLKLFKVINFNEEYRGYIDRSDEEYPFYDKLVFCQGFQFRTNKLVQKYRAEYKKQFEPNIDIEVFKSKYLAKDSEKEKIVGVHIRRGDYETFRDGIYYYDDETYIGFIRQMSDLLQNNCKIVLFTNDSELDFNKYTEAFSNKIMLSKEAVHIDHYIMSECDYLLGPPSSFTAWASYIGSAKLYQIENRMEAFSLDKFAECDSLLI